jgi:hypothetical protein
MTRSTNNTESPYSFLLYSYPLCLTSRDDACHRYAAPCIDMLRHILQTVPPVEGQPVALDDRAAWPWWKLKKWAWLIASKYLERYGNRNYVEAHISDFARWFSKTHTAAITTIALEQLEANTRGELWLPDR